MKNETQPRMARLLRVAGTVLVALVFMTVLGMLALQGSGPVSAAPQAIPTPITVYFNSDNVKTDVDFFSASGLATDTNSTAWSLANYEVLDLQYIIDQESTTEPNTTTIKLQHSNDGTNYVDGQTIVSANVADESGVMTQFYNYGQWTRVEVDCTNTNTLTVSVLAVAK